MQGDGNGRCHRTAGGQPVPCGDSFTQLARMEMEGKAARQATGVLIPAGPTSELFVLFAFFFFSFFQSYSFCSSGSQMEFCTLPRELGKWQRMPHTSSTYILFLLKIISDFNR